MSFTYLFLSIHVFYVKEVTILETLFVSPHETEFLPSANSNEPLEIVMKSNVALQVPPPVTATYFLISIFNIFKLIF